MRIGMAGLNALYWPVSTANGLVGKPEVQFLAAATLGETDSTIKASLGLTPTEYAAQYGLRLYVSAEDMIERDQLDTIVLITPHSQHADWVERLAKKGVNIYIPKTFATTHIDVERILRAEKENGIRIAVGPSARFLPQLAAAKQALDEGWIGKPFSLRICHHHGTLDVFHPQDWYRNPKEGGPELSLAWYGIDLALHFLGDSVESIGAHYGNYSSPESPFMDCGRITMQMAGGATAAFDMYFCIRAPYPSWQLEIVGPKGVISIHRTEQDPHHTVVSLDSTEGHRLIPSPANGPHWEQFWVNELARELPLSVTAEYAGLVTRLSLAALESARNGQVTHLTKPV